MAKRLTILWGFCCLALAGRQSFAADDDALVRILMRADIAHNFAFYCSQFDPSILDRTRSKIGDIQTLMAHMRGEVVSNLPEAEAARIVIRSADAAYSGALRAVRRFYGSNQQEERARLIDWCENTVVPSIQELVAQHDNNHAALDQAIRRAKRSPGSGAGPSL